MDRGGDGPREGETGRIRGTQPDTAQPRERPGPDLARTPAVAGHPRGTALQEFCAPAARGRPAAYQDRADTPPPCSRRVPAPRAARPGSDRSPAPRSRVPPLNTGKPTTMRSEEHTSELQSPCNLVCRLLLEKKKQQLC